MHRVSDVYCVTAPVDEQIISRRLYLNKLPKQQREVNGKAIQQKDTRRQAKNELHYLIPIQPSSEKRVR
jgi:hypothetical protein